MDEMLETMQDANASEGMEDTDFLAGTYSVNGMMNLRNVVILIALALLGVEWIAYIRR